MFEDEQRTVQICALEHLFNLLRGIRKTKVSRVNITINSKDVKRYTSNLGASTAEVVVTRPRLCTSWTSMPFAPSPVHTRRKRE